MSQKHTLWAPPTRPPAQFWDLPSSYNRSRPLTPVSYRRNSYGNPLRTHGAHPGNVQDMVAVMDPGAALTADVPYCPRPSHFERTESGCVADPEPTITPRTYEKKSTTTTKFRRNPRLYHEPDVHIQDGEGWVILGGLPQPYGVAERNALGHTQANSPARAPEAMGNGLDQVVASFLPVQQLLVRVCRWVGNGVWLMYDRVVEAPHRTDFRQALAPDLDDDWVLVPRHRLQVVQNGGDGLGEM